MFKKLFKLIKHIKYEKQNYKENKNSIKKSNIDKIPKSIIDVRKKLNAIFTESEDFVLREIEVGNNTSIKMIVAYIDGLVNTATLENSILIPLLSQLEAYLIDEKLHSKDNINSVIKKIIATSQAGDIHHFKKSVFEILSGHILIYVDGESRAIKIANQQKEKRSISEPENEKSIKGPKEAFIESLTTNVTLLRHIIKNPKFKFETIQLGEQTNTIVGICYVKSIADESVINTVKKRLKKINVDSILDGGCIEQYIEDEPFSIFPTVGNSERPDKVASKILEGRVAIIVDGSPTVLTVPNLFLENLQVTGDYYTRPYFASFNRTLRLISLFLATGLPAFYIAAVIFHFDVIPIRLLLAISATREQIPFSPLIEALFMMIVFEILREVGVRMPNAVGQTINIVGGLVIGQAAVSAKIVSPIMVIIISLTGITNYIMPSLSDVLPIIRFILLFASQALGFLGITITYIIIIIHLCSIESFGVPYMYPMSPADGDGLKDGVFRFPLWTMKKRPKKLIKENFKVKHRMRGKNYVTKEDNNY